MKVLMVCLGNICRSPLADGIMAAMVKRSGLSPDIEADSAGTGSYHAGEAADRRSQAVAWKHGYKLTSRARQFERSDFGRFDYVLAMDRQNLSDLEGLARNDADRNKLALFRSHDPKADGDGDPDVPDPYYGGPDGFEDVFAMCERTCMALLDSLCERHGLTRSSDS